MSDYDALHEVFDHLTDRVSARHKEASTHDDREHRVPPADVVETPTTFVVVVGLPGSDPATIDARVTDKTLHVAAEPKYGTDLENASAEYLRRERDRQSVSRKIVLPQEVDETETSADYTDGVLTVHSPGTRRNSQGTTSTSSNTTRDSGGWVEQVPAELPHDEPL